MATRSSHFDILIAEGVNSGSWEREQSKAIAKGANFEPDENKDEADN